MPSKGSAIIVTGVIGHSLIQDSGNLSGVRLPVDITNIAFIKAEASDVPSTPKST